MKSLTPKVFLQASKIYEKRSANNNSRITHNKLNSSHIYALAFLICCCGKNECSRYLCICWQNGPLGFRLLIQCYALSVLSLFSLLAESILPFARKSSYQLQPCSFQVLHREKQILSIHVTEQGDRIRIDN
jgi:hypothetical protein